MTYVYFALSSCALVVVVWLWLPTMSESWAACHRWVALRRQTPVTTLPVDARPQLLFLIPAHNEETLVAQCVRSIMSMDYPADRRRVVVIADNCTDHTADLARSAGAECLERPDPRTGAANRPH